MSKWQPIETAPHELTVKVKVGRKSFPAIYRLGVSVDENGKDCDQWQAVGDDYPRCWSEGACWTSNADGDMSLPPEAWRPL